MDACETTSRMSAYHDGELSPELRRKVEDHLIDCPVCQEALASMRGISAMFAAMPGQELTHEEMGEIQKAAEAEIDQTTRERSLLRFAGGLLAAAASILIVCGAWWSESGTGTTVPPQQMVVIDNPAWERVAMTLKVDPEPVRSENTALADARLADWMLDRLSGGNP